MYQTIITNFISFILPIIISLVGGAGADLSSMISSGLQGTTNQTTVSKPAPAPAPTTRIETVAKPNQYGCVKGQSGYMDCMNSAQRKNPTLTAAEISSARNQQFRDIVAYRNKYDKNTTPLTLDSNLNRSAQAFAEKLANTPGDRLWHSSTNSGVLENVAMHPTSYTRFVNVFAGSPGHASTMLTNGRNAKVGIGIAQDPVSGKYFCVQQFSAN